MLFVVWSTIYKRARHYVSQIQKEKNMQRFNLVVIWKVKQEIVLVDIDVKQEVVLVDIDVMFSLKVQWN